LEGRFPETIHHWPAGFWGTYGGAGTDALSYQKFIEYSVIEQRSAAADMSQVVSGSSRTEGRSERAARSRWQRRHLTAHHLTNRRNYIVGSTTSVFTGEEIGVMKAVDAASATINRETIGRGFEVLAIASATGAIRTAVAVLEMNKPAPR